MKKVSNEMLTMNKTDRLLLPSYLSEYKREKNKQSGRSMIEMLGVLTIIGALSVGGIAGYTSAMERHKLNKLNAFLTSTTAMTQ